jgi:excisionase family DNA binding protein
MTSGDHERLLTVGEVAKLLGYTVQHTRALIRTGKLKGKKLGRDWAIREADMKDFLETRSSGPESPPKD